MDKQNTHPYTRKDFLKTAGSTALFAALGIGFFGCSSNVTDSDMLSLDESNAITIDNNKVTIDLSSSSVVNLNNQNGWLLIIEAETLVVNVGDNVIRAFTSVCTHAQCSSSWDFRESEFICGCHNSKFNTNGKVTQGPATRDLKEFEIDRNENLLVITKS